MPLNRYRLFFIILGSVMLITSVIISPVKGSTPAFVLCLFSVVLMLTSIHRYHIIYEVIICTLSYGLLYFIAQWTVLLSDVKMPEGIAIIGNISKTQPLLLISHFTQTLYLLPGFCLFMLVRFFFNDTYWKYINFGVLILCVYGLYEVIFFHIFHQYGDFLSNRTFGDKGQGEGSLNQHLTIVGISVFRLKSLTGEPSMFAFSVLPFWAYYMLSNTSKKIYLRITGICLVLSTSTSAVLGFFIYYFQRSSSSFFKYGFSKKNLLSIIKFLILVLIVSYFLIDLIAAMYTFIEEKVTLKSVSGLSRIAPVINGIEYWLDLPFLNKLFGIGFGTVRSLDMTITLLLNNGLIGLGFYVFALSFPIFKKNKTQEQRAIAYALIQVLIVSLISVPEYSYLSLWFFLGLAYPFKKEVKNLSFS